MSFVFVQPARVRESEGGWQDPAYKGNQWAGEYSRIDEWERETTKGFEKGTVDLALEN